MIMTKGYYYGKVVKAPTKKTVKKINSNWDSKEWANYEHNKLENQIANEKIQNLYYETMEKINNAHGELVDKIVRMHKQSKQMSAFDQYEEDFDK